MTINLITFASLLHNQQTVYHAHQAILSELEKHFTVNLVDHTLIHSLPQNEFSVVFIATGGVERLVMQAFESLPRPTLLLADGMQNSLAASLEISSWLRARGLKSEILHGEAPAIIRRIQVLYANFQAQQALKEVRVGVIGPPLFLAHCQQCRLFVGQTSLGNTICGYTHRKGTGKLRSHHR